MFSKKIRFAKMADMINEKPSCSKKSKVTVINAIRAPVLLKRYAKWKTIRLTTIPSIFLENIQLLYWKTNNFNE